MRRLPTQIDPNNPERRQEQFQKDQELVLRLEVAIAVEPRRWEQDLLEDAHEAVFGRNAQLTPTQRGKIQSILKRRGQA